MGKTQTDKNHPKVILHKENDIFPSAIEPKTPVLKINSIELRG